MGVGLCEGGSVSLSRCYCRVCGCCSREGGRERKGGERMKSIDNRVAFGRNVPRSKEQEAKG